MILLARDSIRTRHGRFDEFLFYDGRRESIALTMGDIFGASSVLCRIHSSCLSAHAFGSIDCDCWEQMDYSQKEISKLGTGVIIWLNQEGRDNGHLAKMSAQPFKARGYSQSQAYAHAGHPCDSRDYREAVAVLRLLEIRSVILMTNNSTKAAGLTDAHFEVSAIRPIPTATERERL